MHIVFVIGTAYEMGFAHGTLMKENATRFINAVWAYLEKEVVINILTSMKSLAIEYYSIISIARKPYRKFAHIQTGL